MPIKKSQRKALSSVIGTGAIAVQSIAALSLKTEEFSEAMTDEEFEYLKKLRTHMHKDGELMLKFAHRLRKPSNV